MKYKVKKEEQKGNIGKGLAATGKMFILICWSVVAITLYFTSIKYFAVTPVIVIEAIIFSSLTGYFVIELLIRKIANNGKDEKRILKLQNAQKLLLVLVVPLLFILGYDFIATTVKTFVK